LCNTQNFATFPRSRPNRESQQLCHLERYFLNIVFITHFCLHHNKGGGEGTRGGGGGGGGFIGFNGRRSLHKPQFFTSAMLTTIATTRS